MTTEATSKVSIEFYTGDINAEEGSGKMYVFHCPCPGSLRAGDKETHISTAVQKCSDLGSKSYTYKHQARSNIRPEIGGKVFQTTWNLEEGEIFKVFGQMKVGGWNGRMRTAAMYIRLRAEGPMQRIHANVPQYIRDSVFQSWTVTGRFDVLTGDEVLASGVNVLESCISQLNVSIVEAVFRLEKMEPESRSVPKIRMKKVGKRMMPVKVGKRSLDI